MKFCFFNIFYIYLQKYLKIMANYKQSYCFLRNKELYNSRKEAVSAMKKQFNSYAPDGSLILGRYKDSKCIKTILGIIYNDGTMKTLSIFKTNEIITNFETNNNLHYKEYYENSNPTKVFNP